MATVMVSSPSLESHPLRLLAHSVAEAALKSDPSSPSLPPSPAMLQGWNRFAALDAPAKVPTPRRTLRADATPFKSHTRTRSDDVAPVVAKTSQLLRAQACRSANSSPTKATFDMPRLPLPSLKQIQARVGHRRASSIDELEGIHRPATPPSPVRESRLPSFLRRRAGAPQPRPISMPTFPPTHSNPVQVHIIPPTLNSPTSPTESMGSMTSSSTAASSSPSSSARRVPMITCTRADSESESGSEGDEVLVVPTLDYAEEQGYFGRETNREEKAREMKIRLGLRSRRLKM